MKLYYAYEGSKVTGSIEETDEKASDWISIRGTILQEDVGRDNSILKQVDGMILDKDEDDFKQDRIDNAESSKAELLRCCTQYQIGDTYPRIDSNFFSLLMASQTVKKLNTEFTCEKCDANIAWNNQLWNVDYEQRKIDIDNGEIPNYDFTNNGNPLYTYDECQAELI